MAYVMVIVITPLALWALYGLWLLWQLRPRHRSSTTKHQRRVECPCEECQGKRLRVFVTLILPTWQKVEW